MPGNFSGPPGELLKKARVIPVAMRIEPNERDDALLRRSAKGDEGAFTELYSRHQGPLYRFAMRMTGSSWAAEEIVQDVFMMLVREPKKYDVDRGTLGAFLYGVARNRIMKHLERTPRNFSLDEAGDVGRDSHPQLQEHMTPARWAELHERREQVRAAVLALPPEFREAVVLCELEEMSYDEAARALDCPVGTIRSRLHRGRALLLMKLEMLREVPKRANASRLG
jgi:RNA polymerase sigma-70 factor, ECF subfamily